MPATHTGSQLKADLASRMPPKVILQLRLADHALGASGSRVDVVVALTRVEHPTQARGEGQGGTRARLVVGSAHNDRLLLNKPLVMETFHSPFTVWARYCLDLLLSLSYH